MTPRRRAHCTAASGSDHAQPAGADVAPAPPAGRFVQLLAGELARLAVEAALTFDERAVLERLLLLVDHRDGKLGPFSLTGLASQLGLGASSGRRTLRGYLQRLGAAGVVSWSHDGPGHLEVTAYTTIVHQGRDDERRGFVQIVPSALEDLARRARLSPTAAALLLRLALLADQRSATVAAADRPALGALVGLGTARLGQTLDELVAAGMVRWPPSGRLEVSAYRQFVRVADATNSAAARSQPQRAPSTHRRAADDSSARDPQESPHAQDPRLFQTETPPQTPPPAPAPFEPRGRGWALLTKLTTHFPEPVAAALLAERSVAAELAGHLERLEAGGWAEFELLAHVGSELPAATRSPAKVLRARARALDSSPPSPAALAAAAAAERRKTEVRQAEDTARGLASSPDFDDEEVVAEVLRRYDGEARSAALAVVAAVRQRDVGPFAAGAPGERPRPERDEPPRRRRDGDELPGPTALGALLPAVLGGGA